MQGQSRPCSNLLLGSFDLAQTVVEESLERGVGDRLVRRESDSALRQGEPDELIARRFDRLWAERKHAEVGLARSESEQRAVLVLERRKPVARRLLGLRYFLPDHLSNPFELRSLRLRNSCQVFVERRHRLDPPEAEVPIESDRVAAHRHGRCARGGGATDSRRRSFARAAPSPAVLSACAPSLRPVWVAWRAWTPTASRSGRKGFERATATCRLVAASTSGSTRGRSLASAGATAPAKPRQFEPSPHCWLRTRAPRMSSASTSSAMRPASASTSVLPGSTPPSTRT